MKRGETMADASTTKPAIGFIGLGLMGSRMARRLLEAGYPLGVYNRSKEKLSPFVAMGARAYDTPRDLARQSDVVMSSVTDDAVVEHVLLGTEGALAGAKPGATLIELSSVYPETERTVSAAATKHGVASLDAAVSGSTAQAEAGSLIVLVGGDRDAYERSQPIFDVIGSAQYYVGPSGAGATMKLVVNTLLGVGMQAVAEAVTLGERAGLDKDVLLNVLDHTRVIAPIHRDKLVNARSEDYAVAFPLRLMWKDFGNILRLAHEHETTMPVTAAAEQVYAIEQAKRIDEDFSAVIRNMEQLAGIRTSGGKA
jgi:3-hydroxyisobutyrate dehydrogenase-like beta-hydroxyacid dehydrogenase